MNPPPIHSAAFDRAVTLGRPDVQSPDEEAHAAQRSKGGETIGDRGPARALTAITVSPDARLAISEASIPLAGQSSGAPEARTGTRRLRRSPATSPAFRARCP